MTTNPASGQTAAVPGPELHPVEVVLSRYLMPGGGGRGMFSRSAGSAAGMVRRGAASLAALAVRQRVVYIAAALLLLITLFLALLPFVLLLTLPLIPVVHLARLIRLWRVHRKPHRVPLLPELLGTPGATDALWRFYTKQAGHINRPGVIVVTLILLLAGTALLQGPNLQESFIPMAALGLAVAAYFRWCRLVTYCVLAGWESAWLPPAVLLPVSLVLLVELVLPWGRWLPFLFPGDEGLLMLISLGMAFQLFAIEAILHRATPWLRNLAVEKVYERLF